MTWTRVGQRLSAKAHGVAGVYASYDEMLTRADVNSITSGRPVHGGQLDVMAFACLAEEVPNYLTRMRAPRGWPLTRGWLGA